MYKHPKTKSPSEIKAHWDQYGGVDPPRPGLGSVKRDGKKKDGEQESAAEPHPKEPDIDENGLSKKDSVGRDAFRAPIEAEKTKIVADFKQQGLDPPLDLEERAMKKVRDHTAFHTDQLYPHGIHGGFEANSNSHHEFKRYYPKDMEDDLHQHMLRERIKDKRPLEERDELVTGEMIWAEHEAWEKERVELGIDEGDKDAEEDEEDERERQKLAASGHLAEERRKIFAKEARVAGRGRRDEQRLKAKMEAAFDDDLFGSDEDEDEDDNTPPEPQLVDDEVQKDIHDRFFVNILPPCSVTDTFHVVHTAYGADAVGKLLNRLEPDDENIKIIDCELAGSVRSTALIGCTNSAERSEIQSFILSQGEAKQCTHATDATMAQGKEECYEFLSKKYRLDPYNLACMAIFYDDASFVAVTVGTEHGLVDDEGALEPGWEVEVIDFGAEVLRLKRCAQDFVGLNGYRKTETDPVQCLQDLIQVIAEAGFRPEMPVGLPEVTFEDEPQEELLAGFGKSESFAAHPDPATVVSAEQSNKKDTAHTDPSTVTSARQFDKKHKRTADQAGLDSDEVTFTHDTQPKTKKMKRVQNLALPSKGGFKGEQAMKTTKQQASQQGAPLLDQDGRPYSAEDIAGLAMNLNRQNAKVETFIKEEPKTKQKRPRDEVPDDLLRCYPGEYMPRTKKQKLEEASIAAQLNGKGETKSHATFEADEDDSDGELILTDPDDNASKQASPPAITSSAARKPNKNGPRNPQNQKPEPQLTASGRASKKGIERGKCLMCQSSYYVTGNATKTQCSQKKCPGYPALQEAIKARKAAEKQQKGKKRGAAELDGEEPKTKKQKAEEAPVPLAPKDANRKLEHTAHEKNRKRRRDDEEDTQQRKIKKTRVMAPMKTKGAPHNTATSDMPAAVSQAQPHAQSRETTQPGNDDDDDALEKDLYDAFAEDAEPDDDALEQGLHKAFAEDGDDGDALEQTLQDAFDEDGDDGEELEQGLEAAFAMSEEEEESEESRERR